MTFPAADPLIPPGGLPSHWWRESAGYLTRGGCGEVVDRTLHPIALTITPHRGHLVVIGSLRLQTIHPHPEDRLWMATVKPDVIFRRLV